MADGVGVDADSDLLGGDSADPVTVSVTVPRAQVADLMRYAARLWAPGDGQALKREGAPARNGHARDGEGTGVTQAALAAAAPGLAADAVAAAYRGGTSEHWRPFLKLLAHQPDTWVPWASLYGALGLTDRQCAGMLGAAERRCKGFPPYVKSAEGELYYFYMPSAVAAIVNGLAAQR